MFNKTSHIAPPPDEHLARVLGWFRYKNFVIAKEPWRLKQSSFCINRSRNTCAMTDNLSLRGAKRRGNPLKIFPLPLGEGRILNELTSCKNSGEGVINVKNLSTQRLNVLKTDKTHPSPPLQKEGAKSHPLPLGEGTGFTLAETLITLGIIGVVAMLVLPGVINDFKVKQLEAQFKRADNILSQAFIKTFNEFGYMTPAERTPKGPYNDDLLNQMKEDVKLYNEVWLKQFPKIKEVNWDKLRAKKIYCHDLFGQEASNGAGCYFPAGNYNTSLYILPNGVAVSPLFVVKDTGGWPGMIGYIFDSNGPYKGPNRWGHDIFRVYANSKEYECLCNPTIVHSRNIRGCYWYAHSNINPNPLVEKSKDYWDILYKPFSYWKNED